MAMFGYIGVFWGRKKSWRRMLGLVFVGMLIRNPYALGSDVGFLLSFAAVIGIRIFNERYVSRWRGRLYTTLGASMGVAPVLLVWMEKMNIT
jgi:predicted membrane metal-binding protein